VQQEKVSEDKPFDLEVKLGQAKQRLEADKQRLPNMEKELEKIKAQQWRNVKEQEEIAGGDWHNYDPKISVEFGVDNVIKRHKIGTDPDSKKEDYSEYYDELFNNRVPAELTKREDERRLQKDQKEDEKLKEIDDYKEQVIKRTDEMAKKITLIGREEEQQIRDKIRFK